MDIEEIDVKTLQTALESGDYQLLDVRTEEEYDAGHLPCIHIPLHQLMFRKNELDPAKPLAVVCRSGGRSGQAVSMLQDAGFEAKNVKGGFKAWKQTIDPDFNVI